MRAADVVCRVYMRIVSIVRPNVVAVTRFGIRMNCDSRDFIQRRVRHFGIFEHNLTFFTWRMLKPGDVYLDIGANVGYFTLLAARRVGPAGRVTCVEADSGTFRLLIENVEMNECQNVRALNVAATGEPCRVRIERKDSRNSGMNSIVPGEGGGDVEGWTFERIVGEDLARISFVKIDIEGSEAPILGAILGLSHQMSDRLVIASEVSAGSAHFIKDFGTAGFDVYVIVNVYSIDYYILRHYAKKFSEAEAVHLLPVDRYLPEHSDYIFVRREQNAQALVALGGQD